jgi:anti-sigma factor RsiW
MPSNDLPSRDTLLMWISAYFDGELTEVEEGQLFAAMETDPELEREFLQMEKLLGGHDELPGLTDAILSAVAPEAVSETPEGAALLASAHGDNELSATGEARLSQILAHDPAAATFVAAFSATTEGVSAALSALPETPSVRSASAEASVRAVAAIAADERAELLFSAALDDELDTTEASELERLLDEGHAPEVSLAALTEAVAFTVRAPLEDPAARKAGAAALHVIESEAARAEDAQRAPAERAPVPLADRMRAIFNRFAAPLSLATAAAAVFVMIQQPADKGTPDAPPEDWFAAFPEMKDVVEQQMLAAATPQDLKVLGDNSDTEVQAIDSGSQIAAVFSTEATSITVIWVPEPDEPEENGT